MYKYILKEPIFITQFTYKDFVKWCDDRLKDRLWLSHEAMRCSVARRAVRKKWFFKEKFWEDNFESDILYGVIYPFECRMKEEQKRKETIMGLINFKEMGIDRYDVLCALYNKSHPQGLGFLHVQAGDLTREEAKEELEQGMGYADYVKGRVIKVKLPEDAESFDPRLYDRDNGDGAALAAIQAYIKEKEGA